jgi:signal transduction histidine kinase
LDVIDHGVGFDPKVTSSVTSLGLLNMQERLTLINGELTIESRPGSGTRISAIARIKETCLVEAEAIDLSA